MQAIFQKSPLTTISQRGFSATSFANRRWRLAAKLCALDGEVKKRGLKGDAKHRFLRAGLGWNEGTDAKRIRRLRKEFENQILPDSSEKDRG